MPRDKRVSVALASINRDSLLSVVNSIVTGTIPIYEIIICFDVEFSEKATKEIETLCKANQVNIHIMQNASNMGASFSYNRALEIASGDLIAIASDDDPWAADKIERQIASLETINFRGISLTGAFYISDAHARKVRRPRSLLLATKDPLIQIYSERPFRSIANYYLPMSSALFSSELKSLKFNTDLAAREDLWWLHEAFILGFPTIQIAVPGVFVTNSHVRTSIRDLASIEDFAEKLSQFSLELAGNFLRSHAVRSYIYLGNLRRFIQIKRIAGKYSKPSAVDKLIDVWQLSGLIFFVVARPLRKALQFLKS